jgi:hypothetical protein
MSGNIFTLSFFCEGFVCRARNAVQGERTRKEEISYENSC